MSRFLSPEWITAADAALRARGETLADASVIIQQVVTGGPDGDIEYHVVFDNGFGSVREGRSGSPTVTLTIEYPSAVAIGTGAASAQSEFMAGRLRLEGDASTLLAHREAMENLDDVFASLRTETEF